MANVIIISDSDDSDDCVLESVIFIEEDTKENNSDLYHKVRKENVLLAQLIEKCLSLENTKGMMVILEKNLLQSYYNADKSARESPKFQKNLRRAIYLLNTNPELKYSHIKDLCNILHTFKVKKKVPFVTLATNLEEKNHKSNELRRCSSENLDAICGNSKRTKYDGNHITPFSESLNISMNDTSCDNLDETQQSCLSEEDLLLVEKKSNNLEQTTHTDRKLKIIESKISYYNKRIAALDEQEVGDDSDNSPYIKSEKLKTKIVSLYKELCQLKGSKPTKRMGIRLKLMEGHPPGPTKMLERFLNTNFNSNGDPQFPDFCDVVTCVSAANEKDQLGWSRAQIMKEASLLFTMCGRTLQKRRQYREYRDLMYRVKFNALDKDPAEEDPGLQAVLEENRRLAIKKESDILERYTMMQHLPPKTKSQKGKSNNENTSDVNVSDDKIKADTEIIINNNNNDGIKNDSGQREGDEGENSFVKSAFSNDDNSINNNKFNVNLPSQDATELHNDIKIMSNTNDHAEKTISGSVLLQNVETKIHDVKPCSSGHIKTIVSAGGTNLKIKPLSKVKYKNDIPYNNSDNYVIKDNNVLEKDKVIANGNQKSGEILIEGQVTQKSNGNVMGVFNKLGNDITVSIEILTDS